jgi:wingless-type MMTV integration site family protein 1
MRRQCKCHGMSGSCTMKTCWMRLPHLRTVSNALKDRFDGASRVLVSNAGSLRELSRRRSKKSNKVGLRPYNPAHKPPSRKDLVFFEDSPNFCERDGRVGSSGTSGRACNATSLGVDGCDLMCCGRGYTVTLSTLSTRCNCLFKWCCEVECQTCTSTHALHTCK